MSKKVTLSSSLVKDITTEEIKEAIFCQGNDKEPGSAGYTHYFFKKKTWSIVGDDVVATVKFLFQHSTLLPVFNATTIVLVHKILNPSKTAFIKGRSIVDNTILAQELVKGYGRKSIFPRCTMKIDLQKAFDTLHWDFIYVVMKALDIPLIFIGWIEACFTKDRFSISFNGSLIGFFKGARVVRGLYGYHPKCKKIELTHLSFADDLLIFCKGNVESVVGVIAILDYFYEISGLKLNVAKCDFFVVRISGSNINSIKQITGFNHGFFHNSSDMFYSALQIIGADNLSCYNLLLPRSNNSVPDSSEKDLTRLPLERASYGLLGSKLML
ncbi:uncharacterized protein LOC120206467 [Hibiscus syriacus]|uniref:uncharacterized protein LOC120206467 n=1 Tax=Hibiscus syriacus TaxID=106335 RepID=UPI001921970D|nr:uncharacterized protein LOC120206467 [Hibiscus syriacus]